MARGMAAGEQIVSQANSKAFEDGYSRIYGDRKPQRGRWVWDEAAGRLVSAEDYQPPVRAVDAPIMAGRFYENTRATDGADIGSRAKHRAYMKAMGVAPASDYSQGWYDGRRKEQAREAKKERHQTLERIAYTKWKP